MINDPSELEIRIEATEAAILAVQARTNCLESVVLHNFEQLRSDLPGPLFTAAIQTNAIIMEAFAAILRDGADNLVGEPQVAIKIVAETLKATAMAADLTARAIRIQANA